MKYDYLKKQQSLPLEEKIKWSIERIKEWYDLWEENVYISFSGGKDSTVLLDLVRHIYPNVPAVFSDTGLEFPEIKKFVKNFDNIEKVRPDIPFHKIIKKYGYPVISKKVARMINDVQNPTEKNKATVKLYTTGIKRDGSISKAFKLSKKYLTLALTADFKISHKCCSHIKKKPLKKWEKQNNEKVPFIGTLATDSKQREISYMVSGCNNYDGKKSLPLSIWTEQDILKYIYIYNLPYCTVYGELIKENKKYRFTKEQNTGCMFCMFGVHLEKEPNRFQRMKETHPKHYDYCINKLGCGKVLDFINVPY